MANTPQDATPKPLPLWDNKYIDFGKGVFVTGNSEATVRTSLTTIEFSAANSYDTYSCLTDASGEDLISVEHAVSSNAVTLTRGTGGTSAMKFNYFFIGTLDATD